MEVTNDWLPNENEHMWGLQIFLSSVSVFCLSTPQRLIPHGTSSSAMPTHIPPLILNPTQAHTSQMSLFSGAPSRLVTILFGPTEWRRLCGSAGCGILASDSTLGSGLGRVLSACSSPSAGPVFYSIQPCRLQKPSSYPAPRLGRWLLWTAIWEKRGEGKGVGIDGKDCTTVVLEIWKVVKEHITHCRPKNPHIKLFKYISDRRNKEFLLTD